MGTFRSVILRTVSEYPIPDVGSVPNRLRSRLSLAARDLCESKGFGRPVVWVDDVLVPRGGSHRSFRVSVRPPSQARVDYLVRVSGGDFHADPESPAAFEESLLEDVMGS